MPQHHAVLPLCENTRTRPAPVVEDVTKELEAAKDSRLTSEKKTKKKAREKERARSESSFTKVPLAETRRGGERRLTSCWKPEGPLFPVEQDGKEKPVGRSKQESTSKDEPEKAHKSSSGRHHHRSHHHHKHHKRDNSDTEKHRRVALAKLTGETFVQEPISPGPPVKARATRSSNRTATCPPAAQSAPFTNGISIHPPEPNPPPKSFPIHHLLHKMTTSHYLTPDAKSDLFQQLHSNLVDLSSRAEEQLEQVRTREATAAVQELVGEIVNPKPGKIVSLGELKKRGVLSAYLSGHVGRRRERAASSVYSQEGRDEVWEDFLV